MARWLVPLIALAVAVSGASVQARPAAEGYREMYDAARRCFVVNGNFSLSFKKAGDAANAKLFDDKARTAYDLAFFWAKDLRIPQSQVLADIDATKDAELPKLVRDQAYLTDSAKFCKAKGMM